MKKLLSSILLLIMGLALLGCDPPIDEDGDIVITAGEVVTVEVYSKSILGATCKLDDCEIKFDPEDVDFNNIGEYVIYYEAYVGGEYEKYAVQEVYVVDTTPPVCQAMEHMDWEMDSEADFPEPVCEDNYSFVEIIPDEHIDMTTPGNYYIDYICKDTSGNETVVRWDFTVVAKDTPINDPELNGNLVIPSPSSSGYSIQTISNDLGYELVSVSEGMSIVDAVVSDIDNDGDEDIVYLDGYFGEVYYLRNDGTEFTRVFIDNSIGPQKLEITDLDLDGDDDIIITSWADTAITVYLNNLGTFSKQVVTSSGQPQKIIAIDMDQDGYEDIVDFEYYIDNIAVYGNTNGALTINQYLGTSNVQTGVDIDVTTFDYESDGDMDMMVTDRTNDIVYLLSQENGYITRTTIDTIKGIAPTMFDIDSDGDQDLLVIEYHGDNLYVYENVNGTFINRTILTNTLFDGRSMQILDNNGSIEVFIPGYRTFYVLTDVTLTSATVSTFSIQGVSKLDAQFIDIDSDGDLDIFYHSSDTAFVLKR